MSSLRAGIAGIGFWANGLPDWNDAVAFARAGTLPENAPAKPSPQRLAAVRAIPKPQTADAGDDEYSYGFRLWEAKFYPEAQQQLKLLIDKYPRYPRISYARNLLGRAYLDDGKPRDAAAAQAYLLEFAETADRVE